MSIEILWRGCIAANFNSILKNHLSKYVFGFGKGNDCPAVLLNNVYVAAAAVIDLSEVLFCAIICHMLGCIDKGNHCGLYVYPRVASHKLFYGQLWQV